MQQHPAYLYLFDMIYVDAYEVRSLLLKDRKALLRESVDWSYHARWTRYQAEKGADARLFTKSFLCASKWWYILRLNPRSIAVRHQARGCWQGLGPTSGRTIGSLRISTEQCAQTP